jgi:hypothetical protein
MRTGQRIAAFLVLAAVAAPATAAAPRKVLPFIQDDYATALAEARARNVPVFVEAWAPW